MTAEEVQKLVEAGIRTARLPEEARAEATRLLEKVPFKPTTKAGIVEAVLRGTLPVKEGALDNESFGKLVLAEAQRIGAMIAEESGMGSVRHMGLPGVPSIVAPKPEEIAARESQKKADEAASIAIFESLGMTPNAAKHAAKGRAA